MRLQGFTMGCNGETSGRRRLKGIKRVTGEYRGLHGFTTGCRRLQGITGG